MSRTKLNPKFKIQSGFTFIEIIMYVALLSIILTGLVQMSWNMIYGRVKVRTQQELNHQVRTSMTRINYEIRNASAINSVTSTSLSLTQTDVTRNPTIIDLVGGRLRIGFGSSGPCPTSSPCFLTSQNVIISDLTFSNFSTTGSKQIVTRFSASVSGGLRQEYQSSVTLESSAEVQQD